MVGDIDHNIWDGYILESYGTAVSDANLPFWELIRQTGIFQYARADGIFSDGISEDFTGYVKQLVQYGELPQTSPPSSSFGPGPLYTEDEQGNPQYNFWFLDAMLDMFVSHGLKPVLQLEYMPEDLVDENEKVRNFQGSLINGPNDHDKFRELMYQTAKHCIARYGIEEVRTWFFVLRNEPDIDAFFTGSMESYLKMYDYFADGIKTADEQLKVGGPNIAFHDWLRPFIEHCVNGTNFATGGKGAPLDAIFWHSYETIDAHLQNAGEKLGIINQYPSLADIPTIIDEWGQVLFKWINGIYTNYERGYTLYTNYDAAYLSRFIDGTLNEPEKYPSRVMRFGFTNNFVQRYLSIMSGDYFVPMPILNAYILLAKMGDERIELSGSECGDPVHGFAARTENGVQVLLYHFNETDDECKSDVQDVNLTITELPEEWTNMKRYQIDSVNSNAWANHEVDTTISWSEYRLVEEDSKLKIIERTDNLESKDGQVTFRFSLPPNSVSLIVIGEEALPPQLNTNLHIERLVKEETAYISALEKLNAGDRTSARQAFEQIIEDSFSATGKETINPYSIWGQKALWSLYTLLKSLGSSYSAEVDELRIRLLATTALNDVERFTLLNERIGYLKSTGYEDEIPALMEELNPIKSKLEYFANWAGFITLF